MTGTKLKEDDRMKCLEFLYFYLLDETSPSMATPPTAPASPERRQETDRMSSVSWGSLSSICSTIPEPAERTRSRAEKMDLLGSMLGDGMRLVFPDMATV
jgi:hypothetical protein